MQSTRWYDPRQANTHSLGAQVLTRFPSFTTTRQAHRSRHQPWAVSTIALVAVWLGSAPPIAAQWAESPLLRRGQVSAFITPFLTNFDERYGLTADGQSVVEPLGTDLNRATLDAGLLPALVGPQQRFAALLQDSAVALNLGASQTRVMASVVRIPVGVSVGIFDWLTVGGVAPLVKRRLELDLLLDPDGANTGLSPGTAALDVELFLGQANGALASVSAQVDATCSSAGETDPACVVGRSFLTDASSFFAELAVAYGGPLFLFGQGSAADVLSARVDSLRAQMHTLAGSAGIDTAFTAPLPFATDPLSVDQYQTFISDGAYGIGGDPLTPFESLWELGDVEVFAALRLLGTDHDPAVRPKRSTTPDSTAARTSNVSYLLGLKTTYRLGTGTPTRATSSWDLGTGDGLDDIEVTIFGRLDVGARLRGRLEAVYGRQLPGDVTSRVYERDQPFASFLTQLPRRVDPGDYRSWMLAPEIRLTPELSIGARYRSFHQAKDSYDAASVSEVEAALLAAESEIDLTQWGVGVSFWPSSQSVADGAWPIAITGEYLSSTSGAGGQVPKGGQLRLQLRLFVQAWGRSR